MVWHFLLAAGLLSLATPVLARAWTEAETPPEIRVRIMPLKRTYAIGEPISVKVEIWNSGSHDLFIFIARESVDCGGFANIHIRLEDSKGNSHGHGCAADCGPPAQESNFAHELSKNWLLLAPAHFFGTIITLEGEDLKIARRRGRYRLRAEYSSEGMGFPYGVYCNRLLEHPDELKGLPFPSWKGTIRTNDVWIEVVGPNKALPTEYKGRARIPVAAHLTTGERIHRGPGI